MRRWLVPLTTSVLLIVVPAGAEGQATSEGTTMLAVTPGDSVRIDATRIGQVEGRFIGSNQQVLALVSRGSALEVPLDELERLWVRGRATRKGAWIGTAVGAAAGVVFGLLISDVACGPDDGGDCTALEVASAMGVLGAASGGVVGLGVGFAIPRWHLRFP